VAELLHTGDSARRAGNEFLYQTLAQQNVETLNEVGAARIVVTCAHCFNTIKNEYPQLGGRCEVLHHTQLVNRLVRDQRLTSVARPAPPATTYDADAAKAGSTGAKVTYHDPVLPRPAQPVDAPPWELLGTLPGVEYAEMPPVAAAATTAASPPPRPSPNPTPNQSPRPSAES
jgi:Fe-S oxidoreductase